jgi:hypothetical protein
VFAARKGAAAVNEFYADYWKNESLHRRGFGERPVTAADATG